MIEKLQVVLLELQDLLGEFGEVVIAGGSVRDALMGKQYKDIDCFILSGGYGDSWGKLATAIRPKLENYKKINPVVEWHKSEPYLLESITHECGEIQIMLRNLKTADELLDTFDWNISLFALTNEGVISREDIQNIRLGGELWTQNITHPKSTLRRGYRFSERFKMKIRNGEIEKICQKIIDNIK